MLRAQQVALEHGAAALELGAHAALALQLQALRQHRALQPQHARALRPQRRPRVRCSCAYRRKGS